MPPFKNTAVIFDLDGVLVDSRAAITSCIKHALDAQGLPEQGLDSLEQFIGPPLTLAFAELTGHPQNSELVLACLASYRTRYAEASRSETTLFPEIPAVLATLADDHQLAVATSKPRAFTEPLLMAFALRDKLDHVAAPDLDAHLEDKETTIRSALSALGASQAVMVGDRSFDIIGAHTCGIPAIGVSWGIGTANELASADPEVIVDTPRDLPAAIGQLLS